ncbi:MAG TPA: FG-GAP-like repeat-containing protein [Phycisphaerales bacterium]|nr:FG-GAP-like repeat-containing protein [Phycisphaerales bacterium]
MNSTRLALMLTALGLAAAAAPAGTAVLEPKPVITLPAFNQAGYPNTDVADVNGDGRLDLVLFNYLNGPNRFEVRLNNGDGTFAAPVTTVIPGSAFARMYDFADLNGDAREDAVIAISPGGDNLMVMLGTLSGGFAFHSTLASGGAVSYPLALGDMNADGHTDIVANAGSGISVRLGNGDATFAPPIISGATQGTAGELTLGDVDGDGDLDVISRSTLASTDSALSYYSVSLNDGSGTLSPLPQFTLPVRSFGEHLAQLDSTPAPELVVFGRRGTNFGAGGLFILRWTGTEYVTIHHTPWTSLMGEEFTVADLDADGFAEIVIAQFGQLRIMANDGNAGFPTFTTIAGPDDPYDVLAADLFGTALPDLLAVRDTISGQRSLHPYENVTPVAPTCPADFSGDGVVNTADITAFLAAWFADLSGGTLASDFDGSGVVNASDISAFLGAWFQDLASGC